MLSTAIVVFREVLEAALIIGLVAAATNGLQGRGKWIGFGITSGVIGSIVIAWLADVISQSVAGIGQELLNAIILFLAVVMLGWHNVWMRAHAAELTVHMKRVGASASKGELPLYMLSIVVGLAVLREGAESVLFLYGMYASGTSIIQISSGSLFGLSIGVAFGAALYFGLLRIPMRMLFRITSIMLLLVAAGMAAKAASFLVQADLLPALGNAIWDTSWILTESSLLGRVLHTLVGYISSPMGVQLIFYIFTLLIIVGSMKFVDRKPQNKLTLGMGTVAILLVAIMGMKTQDANAGSFKTYSPNIEAGEVELEAYSHTMFDSANSKNGNDQYKFEIGYGIRENWFTAIYGEIEKNTTNNKNEYVATAWENIITLTDQGKYWADLGLYLEYEVSNESAGTDKIETKLLLEKQHGDFIHSFNFILERRIGTNATNETEYGYAWRSKWVFSPRFSTGIEAYGEFGEVGNPNPKDKQEHRAGPVFYGDSGKTQYGGKFKYEVGFLFGLTDATSDGTLKGVLEYEFRF